MRIGVNPAKESAAKLSGYGLHRVVMPVYIPAEEGYFRESRAVLAQCLASLVGSAGDRIAVTLVVNAATPAVMRLLNEFHEQGHIDQLIVQRENRGKVDAVVPVIRGLYEPFVTVADSDVYFHRGWLENAERIFREFPEAGFVSAFPAAHLAWNCTSATVLGALLRGELQHEKCVSDEDLLLFARGAGNEALMPESVRRAQWTVRRNGFRACVGASHMQFTVRREVAGAIPREPAALALDGLSDRRWLDEPADRLGYWRLSTTSAWVEHLGNVPHVPRPARGADGVNHSGSGASLPPGPLAGKAPWLPLPYAGRVLASRVARKLLGRRSYPRPAGGS